MDRARCRGPRISGDNAPIAETILAIAKNLRLKVVGEGVETEHQAAFLRKRGCDELQGHLFSRPVPAQDFLRFLETAKDGVAWSSRALTKGTAA